MSFVALLLLTGTVQSAQAALPPIIMAFEGSCAGTKTAREAAERALADKWSEEPPASGSPLAAMVALSAPAAEQRGRTFTREVDGRRLHLWVRESLPAPMGSFVECKIFDFVPAEPLTIIQDALGWQGAPPEVDSGSQPSGHAVVWAKPGGVTITAEIQRPGCPNVRLCSPRIVLEQHVEKED